MNYDIVKNTLLEIIKEAKNLPESELEVIPGTSIKVKKGKTLPIDEYNQEIDGYEFLGWFTTSTLTNQVDEKFIFTANKTLYAAYSKVININEIDNIDNINTKSYTIVSVNNEHIDYMHINKLLNLGAKRIDLTYCQVKNNKITSDMFKESNIEEIIIGDSVNIIDNSAFENCYNLKEIKLNSNIITIGKKAFKNCYNLNYINIFEGLKEIKEEAFVGCNKLDKIYLPTTIENIENNFIRSQKLKDIIVNSDNNYYQTISGILYSKDLKKVIKCPEDKNGNIVLNSNVQYIEDYSFYNSKIESITIPSNIKNIGKYSFYNCQQLINFKIEDSIDYKIENNCFENCFNLTEVELGEGLKEIGEDSFKNNFKLKNIDLNISSLIYIGNNCFYECKEIENIIIPNSVDYIGNNVFYECIKLKNVIVGDKVKNLPNRMFYNCKSLESITLLGAINILGDSVFYNCKNLKSISNLDTVSEIGNSCFYNCEKIKNISLINVNVISKYSFYNVEILKI